jgi:transcriptional regulator with XRE-family HTH domain
VIRLEFERRRAGLTRARLAELAGVQAEIVGAVERGAIDPDEATLEALARILQVHPGKVLGREVRPRREPEEYAIPGASAHYVRRRQ